VTSRIGIIGCGNISGIYFQNLAKYKPTEVVACADLDHQKAQQAAENHGIARACSVEELLADPSIDIVLNLTVPNAHYQVAMAALEVGKSVYNEKPLTITREEGLKMLDVAKSRGLLVGCAPDTFLGGAFQTCRKLIDEGAIGEPVGANCFMLCHGHESWHPSPEFYYEVGGGPMFDMGPYYLTALVSLIGGIKAVSATTRVTFPTRTIKSEPKRGKVVQVETPTHIVAALEFANGAIAQITTSFDVWHSKLPNIELYGTEGSLLVPDPNGFGGQVWLRRAADADWSEVPLSHGFASNSRGLGVMDMAYARAEGRSNRASGDLAYHVLDVMHACLESGAQGRKVTLESAAERPAPLSAGLSEDDLIN
jgi:predicted dehydrogenase